MGTPFLRFLRYKTRDPITLNAKIFKSKHRNLTMNVPI